MGFPQQQSWQHTTHTTATYSTATPISTCLNNSSRSRGIHRDSAGKNAKCKNAAVQTRQKKRLTVSQSNWPTSDNEGKLKATSKRISHLWHDLLCVLPKAKRGLLRYGRGQALENAITKWHALRGVGRSKERSEKEMGSLLRTPSAYVNVWKRLLCFWPSHDKTCIEKVPFFVSRKICVGDLAAFVQSFKFGPQSKWAMHRTSSSTTCTWFGSKFQIQYDQNRSNQTQILVAPE